MYPFLIGVLLYFVLKSDFFILLLFIILWELFIFLGFRKLSFQPRPFERLSYNVALLIGYFYNMWMYGIVKFNDIDDDSII